MLQLQKLQQRKNNGTSNLTLRNPNYGRHLEQEDLVRSLGQRARLLEALRGKVLLHDVDHGRGSAEQHLGLIRRRREVLLDSIPMPPRSNTGQTMHAWKPRNLL